VARARQGTHDYSLGGLESDGQPLPPLPGIVGFLTGRPRGEKRTHLSSELLTMSPVLLGRRKGVSAKVHGYFHRERNLNSRCPGQTDTGGRSFNTMRTVTMARTHGLEGPWAVGLPTCGWLGKGGRGVYLSRWCPTAVLDLLAKKTTGKRSIDSFIE